MIPASVIRPGSHHPHHRDRHSYGPEDYSATTQSSTEAQQKYPHHPQRDYLLGNTSNDINTQHFKLDQVFLPTNGDLSLCEGDIRVVVFQQGEKRACPQPLYDTHRPIARPSEAANPKTRARSSSARNIENDRPNSSRRSSLCYATPANSAVTRSAGEPTPFARPTASCTDPTFRHRASAGSQSQASQSSSQSIVESLAASLSSFLTSPSKPSSNASDADQHGGTHRSAGQRPTSPSLSVASRCSTPRNPATSSTSSNSWYELPLREPPNTHDTSPATAAKISDHKLLGEMIDSLPMRGCQASVKIHQLKSPSRLMMTYNFTMYVRKQGRGSPTSDDSFCVSSCSSYGPESTTSPLRSSTEFLHSSSNMFRSASDQALAHSDMFSTSSHDTRRRPSALLTSYRPSMTASSRLATPVSTPQTNGGGAVVGGARSRSRAESARAATPGGAHLTPASSMSSVGSSGYNSLHEQRMSGSDGVWSQDEEPVPMKALRFAVVILIETPPENSTLCAFLHTHWPLLMRHTLRVRDGIESAVTSKLFLKNSPAFVEAQEDLCRRIASLWSAPRVESPVWLSLSAFEYSRRQIGCGFVREFIRVSKEFRTGGHDRFLPSVLTAVLSHHVGWVASVQDGSLRRSLTDSKLAYPDEGDKDGNTATTAGADGSTAFGYQQPPTGNCAVDALHRQMSEVHGALCWPRHLARTVVVGQAADAVAVMLHVLTFFIRSSDIIDTTSDLRRECKDAAGSFMRSRTPIRLGPPRCSSQTKPIPRDLPFSATKQASAVLHHRDGLRSPLPEESNLYQSNLDHFSCGDFTPTNPALTGRNLHRARSSDTTPPGSHNLMEAVIASSGKRHSHLDLHLRNPAASSSSLTSELRDSPTTPLTVKSPSPPPFPSDPAVCGEASEAIAIGVSPSGTAQQPHQQQQQSLLSSSLQRHDEAMAMAKETLSRESHRRWVEWMATMKPVNMSSPPGSPTAEQRPFPVVSPSGNVFAPLHGNVARSLIGGLCADYQSDFILHGTSRPHNEVLRRANYDLKLAVQHSVLSCPVASAVCIIANVDRRSCEMLSQSRPPPDVTTQLLYGKQLLESQAAVEASGMIVNLVMSVVGVWDLGMSELMCLLHLEDGLRQVLKKCKMASEYLARQPSYQLDQRNLKAMFGVDESDMELVMSINRVLWSPDKI